MTNAARHILIVDDEIGIRELLRDILQDEGYHVHLAENAAEARAFRHRERPDVVLLDIWMPDCDGITLLKEWVQESLLNMSVIMMSGHGTIDTAVEAVRMGAFAFLEKPIALQKLLTTVESALKTSAVQTTAPFSLLNLGKSPVMNEIRQRLEQLSKTSLPLFFVSPKGGCLELCARFVHKPNTPWLMLKDQHVEKLAVSPLDLLKQTSGGLIFVPEIADFGRLEQRGLMLLLEKAETYGVRIVAGTSHSLNDMLENKLVDVGLLRALSVVSIKIPALQDHADDIPDLVNIIARKLVENGDADFREFSVAALNVLRTFPWAGDFEQLQTVVRNLLLTSLGKVVEARDVTRVLQQFSNHKVVGEEDSVLSGMDLDKPLREARDDFERMYFQYHIARTGGNVSRLAELVELERTHLYRKLKQLNIRIFK